MSNHLNSGAPKGVSKNFNERASQKNPSGQISRMDPLVLAITKKRVAEASQAMADAIHKGQVAGKEKSAVTRALAQTMTKTPQSVSRVPRGPARSK